MYIRMSMHLHIIYLFLKYLTRCKMLYKLYTDFEVKVHNISHLKKKFGIVVINVFFEYEKKTKQSRLVKLFALNDAVRVGIRAKTSYDRIEDFKIANIYVIRVHSGDLTQFQRCVFHHM